MKPNSPQAKWIMRYLLGELSEEEQSRLEEEYFADPDLFQEVRAARDDLIDAYLRGELSDHERSEFEEHFLASPHRRERVEFARTLMTTVDQAPLSDAQPIAKQQSALRRKWFLVPQLSFKRAMVALAVLAVVFAGSWLLLRSSRMRPEHANRATQPTQTNQPGTIRQPAASPNETPGPDLANIPPTTPPARATPDQKSDIRIATFTLSPGALRDSRAKVLIIPRSLTLVELRLEVEGEPYQSYQAELRTPEGDRKWNGTNITPESVDSPRTVVVKLPAALFENADYLLRLSGVTVNGETVNVGSYYFRVERR